MKEILKPNNFIDTIVIKFIIRNSAAILSRGVWGDELTHWPLRNLNEILDM